MGIGDELPLGCVAAVGGTKDCLTRLRVVGTLLALLPFPFPSQERLGHGAGAVPWPLRPQLQPGWGTESPDRFQGGAYCACAGSYLKEGVGKEGAKSQGDWGGGSRY